MKNLAVQAALAGAFGFVAMFIAMSSAHPAESRRVRVDEPRDTCVRGGRFRNDVALMAGGVRIEGYGICDNLVAVGMGRQGSSTPIGNAVPLVVVPSRGY